MARERQRIAYTHRAFAAFKAHTQESIITEMSTRGGVYKNATNCASTEGGGYVLVLHSIPQLAARLSTWVAHMEDKSEPNYALGFTVPGYLETYDSTGMATSSYLRTRSLWSSTTRPRAHAMSKGRRRTTRRR
jgi:hypothetical protein